METIQTVTSPKNGNRSAVTNARQDSYDKDDYNYTPTPAMIEAAKQDYALRVYTFTQNQLRRATSENNDSNSDNESSPDTDYDSYYFVPTKEMIEFARKDYATHMFGGSRIPNDACQPAIGDNVSGFEDKEPCRNN
ncbi:8128_t:CDS:2 [Ambispora leptoticha]|uniref:8128_t:CDS:1 n=1 Tax=Ambispora leptoticha TaxID=144679 RepID=A0A9N9FIY0_9GLOM|nr:8128_t:CDS:2 [Ambispora leptoticha]